jgi:hypothetical protein
MAGTLSKIKNPKGTDNFFHKAKIVAACPHQIIVKETKKPGYTPWLNII